METIILIQVSHFYITDFIIGKASKRTRRTAQVFREMDRSSLRNKLGEIESQKQNASRESLSRASLRSDFSDSQIGAIESSLKDTMDKNKDKSVEVQDDESVKALLTGYEDLTNNINAYFKTAHATNAEAIENNSVEIQLTDLTPNMNDTSEYRGVDTTIENYDAESIQNKSFKDLISFDKINQSQKNDKLFKSSKLLLK